MCFAAESYHEQTYLFDTIWAITLDDMYDTEMKVPVQINIKHYIIDYKNLKQRIGHVGSDVFICYHEYVLSKMIVHMGWSNKNVDYIYTEEISE